MKKAYRQLLIAILVGFSLITPARAQDRADPIEFAGWEIEPRADSTIAISPGRDDAGTTEAEVFTAHVRAELRADYVLENGAEIGVHIGGRLQRDHTERSGFSGRIGDGSAFFNGLAPRGAFTGLTLGGPVEDTGVRAQLETAFAYIDGGYGQLLVGRDVGIARRFHEGSPSIFRQHRIVNAALDTSGIATVLTRNDLTGPATKLSYASPRILGLRLGASYTPRANLSGLDRDPDRDTGGVAEPSLENGLEAAFNFNHRFRESGVRLEGYGAYSRADVETGPLRSDAGTVEVWSSGGRIEWENLEFGADWLTTDNAGGRYRAWSIGAKLNQFGLDWSAEYGRSFDNLTSIDGQSWSIGGAHTFYERLTIGAGIQSQSLNGDVLLDQGSLGPVLEITLRY